MGPDRTENGRTLERVVIYGSNWGNEELGYFFCIWVAIFLCLVMISIYHFYGNVYYYLIMLITLLWFVYYVLRSKSIYVLEQGLSGPFFELKDVVYRPFKTRFYIPFKKIQKIGIYYYEETDNYYIKIFVEHKYYKVGLQYGEDKRLLEVMNKVHPHILVEKKH